MFKGSVSLYILCFALGLRNTFLIYNVCNNIKNNCMDNTSGPISDTIFLIYGIIIIIGPRRCFFFYLKRVVLLQGTHEWCTQGLFPWLKKLEITNVHCRLRRFIICQLHLIQQDASHIQTLHVVLSSSDSQAVQIAHLFNS